MSTSTLATTSTSDICDSNHVESEDKKSTEDEPAQGPANKSDGSELSKKKALHVSVQRNKISSTTVEEGGGELEDLDVEVYDQQTYENGVFEQVNEAISSADNDVSKNSRDNNAKDNIKDLFRIIHETDDGNTDPSRPCDIDARDERVIELARRERIKKSIKREKPDCDEVIKKLPRIPKITIKIERDSQPTPPKQIPNVIGNHRQPTPGASSSNPTTRKSVYETKRDVEYVSSDDESPSSEYKPQSEDADTSEEEFDENVEFESDPESHDSADENTRSRGSRAKRLQDDGDFKCYQSRIKAFSKSRAQLRLNNILEDGTESKQLDELVQVEGDLHVPKEIWEGLFEHQKTGIKWLWELHQLGTGGILGDEMGLGKTIQMIAFLTALKSSNVVNTHMGYENLGPTVLVCPATVMHQWLLEFRKWWAPFRVAILHSTGTFSGEKRNLVQVINKSRGILIVSYPGVIIYQDVLHKFDWHYAILDEGHKIRNPDAQVTLACKRFRTPHRIILSGSPVQNNLKELWSIFDFIYPGKLGTLPVFMEQFATPITQGGYANASDFQVQIAYKCSCVLRDTIKPFLLRRTKAEVNNKLKLPDRSEQVLFCKLTDKQRKLYQAYLDSPTIRDIKSGFCQIFVGLIQLRKICNHPDLFDSTDCRNQIKQLQQIHYKKHLEFFSEDETYGHMNKSGKMMVVDALLKLWKKQEHKVLLFTQSRQMLKIFISYLNERNYKHLIMDGATPIGARQTMIEEFNSNPEVFIFLLTTRVGGVGVNLTGANRIIIYDPDWNPSTDIQARERAWRIGQQRHVIIYRLLTAGTIEEKIYHRQVFKLYLTNRVLKNAQQKRFFKTNDLHELFTLGDNDKNIETKALFDDDLQINPESLKRDKEERKAKKKSKRDHELTISEEKLQSMRDRAKRLSQMIALKYGSQSDTVSGSQVRIKIEPGLEYDSTQTQQDARTIKVEPGISKETPQANQPEEGEIAEKSKTKGKHTKQHVKYLVKQDIYRPDDGESKNESRHKRDDYILERLFKNSNIFGALKHDRIETDSTADYKVVESEAEKVARDAIKVLRDSRRMCLSSTSGIPNWTGRNGHVASRCGASRFNRGKIQSRNTSHAESGTDSIIAAMKKRNHINPVALARSTFQAANESDEDEVNKDFEGRAKSSGAEDMAGKIRDFILFKSSRNGEAQTEELLDFFKRNYSSEKTAIFKAILYKMCEFHRRADKGFWLLKTEFKNT